MDALKQKFHKKSAALRDELRAISKSKGDTVVGEVKLSQVLGGARGVKMMLWETSELDANEGIRFRGYSIPQLREVLPKAKGCNEPLPEGLFWLMLIGEVPTAKEVKWLSKEWQKRAKLPAHTYNVINALPKNTHPMVQFSVAIASMESTSLFSKGYAKGMSKKDYWDPTYEDAMNLVARLPVVAAYIYRRVFHDDVHIAADRSLDWAANFAHMLGINDEDNFKSLMRLYLTIHADHEGGNASAHTAHLIGSTLSSSYLSYAGAMNSLAGPLHGLANQEVIKWIFEMIKSIGKNPSKAQITAYVKKTLKAGKVIPGYGHAVLREPDPRFIAQRVFAEEHLKDAEIVQVVWKVFDVVPGILKGLGKVKNPWPNVDAHSGAILVHYGMTEYPFYTVLFGVSRSLGVLAASCWSRALGMALERPKSVTSEWVKEVAKQKKKKK